MYYIWSHDFTYVGFVSAENLADALAYAKTRWIAPMVQLAREY